MTSELVPIPVPDPQPPELASASPADELVAAFLAGRSPRTLKAYSNDLAHFARWASCGTPASAIRHLLGLAPGDANHLVLKYRNGMKASGLAPATIARRLAALRSIVKLGRQLGRVNWTLDVDSPRAEARRDVRGPEKADRKKLWKALEATVNSPKGARDRAIVALLFDRGLRRGEALALDLGDVDLKGGTVAITGKGHSEKERLTIPPQTRKALAEWISIRGDDPGPLFHRMDRGNQSRDRLTGDGLARTLARIGRKAQLSRPLRPHGLRHAAITAALDAGIDVRGVRLFSRHVKIETVMRYDDARADVAGEIAKKISGERR